MRGQQRQNEDQRLATLKNQIKFQQQSIGQLRAAREAAGEAHRQVVAAVHALEAAAEARKAELAIKSAELRSAEGKMLAEFEEQIAAWEATVGG